MAYELWRDVPPPWFVPHYSGIDVSHQQFCQDHNALAHEVIRLLGSHNELVGAHNAVRDLAVELGQQLVEQRQVRAEDVEDTLKVLEAAGQKVLLLEECLRSLEADTDKPVSERSIH